MAGGALRVHLTAASMAAQGASAGGGGGAPAAIGCHVSDFMLHGLESSSSLQAAACAHPTAVWPDIGGAFPAATDEAAFLLIESRCPLAAVLTLAWGSSSGSSGSGSSGEGGEAGATLRRKLLQQRQAPAPLQQPNNGTAGIAQLVTQQPLQEPGGNSSSTPGTPSAVPGDKDPTSQLPLTPSPPSDLPDQACCCPNYRDLRPYQAGGYPDRQCCCGNRRRCCGRGSSLLGKMCADKSMCSVLLVVIGVLSLFLIAVCTMGGMCYRRRRQRAERAVGARPASSRARTAEDLEAESMMALPEEKQAELRVRPAEAGDPDWRGSCECSVCLEKVEVTDDTWRVFPCAGHHGICTSCVVDIVKHNRRRKGEHKRVVACPLCRALAIVPQTLLPVPSSSGQPPSQVTIL